MRRREFLSTVAAGSAAVGATAATDRVRAAGGDGGRISEVVFDSAASLLDADGKPLTDDSLVAVWAGPDATNADADGNGDAVNYPDGTAIPMVAAEGNVMAFGGTFVADGTDWRYGNEEFLLNAWDAKAGSGTVLWDEGHGQFYTKDKFATFANYAGENGYDVRATSSLADDLPDADAVVITSPSSAFSDGELSALSSFVEGGGAVFLHHQSDFRDYDQTDNLDAIASALGVGFRFNDDQVVDAKQNAGVEYVPVTSNFNDAFPFYEDRDGLELDGDETYTVTVTRVLDGDTVEVAFDDGREDTVRILGIDTPEKPESRDAENVDEWEGIDDIDHLQTWSKKATEFAREKLGGTSVTLSFDGAESVRGNFGRLLGYLEYPEGGSTSFYNRQAVSQGYARVYGSAFSLHDEFRRLEERARAEGRGLWAASDVDALEPIRNDPVEETYFPKPSSVETTWGRIEASRVPVFAGDSADQTVEDDGGWFGGFFGDGVEYEGRIPLVGVDAFANVAMVGAPLAIDDYEKSDGYEVDTSNYDNYTFLTNLLDALSDREGDVLIDGGHGQVGSDGSVANEDAVVYQRYLEGVDLNFDQVNDVASADLSDYRAVIVAMPPEPFAYEEAAALREFAFDGGAVILLGANDAPDGARENLNDLAGDVGTDLRLNADTVTDAKSNVNDDETIPVTDEFAEQFDLFSPFPHDEGDGGDGGSGGTTEIEGTVESGGTATHTHAVSGSPSKVVVELAGAEGTDFDLYVTLDGRTPSARDFDYRSWNYGSEESVTIPGSRIPDGGKLGIAVDAYSGSGSYTLTIAEE